VIRLWSAGACSRFGVGGAVGSDALESDPIPHPPQSGSKLPHSTVALLVACVLLGCDDNPTRRATPTSSPSTTATPPPTATATAIPSPTMTSGPSCASRTGGAVITFAICERTLTVWSTAPGFIDEAIALLAAGEQRIPVFAALLDGADCDAQWSWHPDPGEMSFADFTIELCDGCPFHIEDDKPYWLDTVDQYCPWTAQVTAVDDRRVVP